MTPLADGEPLVRWDWVGDHTDLLTSLTFHHLKLALLPILFGLIIAVPLGILCVRWRWLYPPTLGVANVLNRAWHDALEVLEQALAIGRARRLLFLEGGILATMGAAHVALGDRARALALAEDAIALCRRLGVRFWEFSAQLTRIRALRETHGLQATKEIEAALAEAEAWLEMSGAKSYEPFLHVERAELARLTGDDATRERELCEARRLFLEIGAPIRAAEVGKELDR